MDEKVPRRSRRDPRWLIRRDTQDYGPYTTQQVLKAIDRKELDLGTLVTRMGTDSWQPAGVHRGFRDHYANCEERWSEEALNADVAREERKLRAMDRFKGGAGKGLILGVFTVLVLGSWLVYRIIHAEPTGIMNVVVVPTLPTLPAIPEAQRESAPLVLASAVTVKRRWNAQYFNTSGVKAEGKERALRGTVDLSDGGSGLSMGAVNRIKKGVKKRLIPCLRAAMKRKSPLRKVSVTYIVSPGRLGGITLNRKALKDKRLVACVKRVIKRTPVPRFKGAERRVRQGFRIQ